MDGRDIIWFVQTSPACFFRPVPSLTLDASSSLPLFSQHHADRRREVSHLPTPCYSHTWNEYVPYYLPLRSLFSLELNLFPSHFLLSAIVISPLLSLIADQIIHLHENDIPSVMLTSSVPKPEQTVICRRLVEGPTRASGSRSRAGEEGALSGEDGREIKLVYVTVSDGKSG